MSKTPENKMAPPAPAPAPANTGTCVLGPTLHFKGELYGEEDLEFQGQLEGSIEHTRSLSIGKDGGVTGNIKAKFVIVEGRVDGDIYASESVSVRQSAKVKGNIYAPRVGIVLRFFRGVVLWFLLSFVSFVSSSRELTLPRVSCNEQVA